jgi:phosphoglycerol transferase
MDDWNGVSRRDRLEPEVPIGRRLPVAAEYAIAVLLSLALLVWSYQLWQADLRIPLLYQGDALYHQMLVKGTIEHGWYLNNKSLGAPLGLQMHDFPFVDGLFFALLKLISLPSRDWGLTVNLFYLLTFPLTTVTGLYAMRRLGVSYAPALVGALLYTFLPYHFTRGEGHLYLSCYFLVPLIVPVAVRILLGRGVPFRREGSDGVVRWDLSSRESLRVVGLCLLMGSGGIYYACFSCFLLLLAGIVGSLNRRRLYPLVASCLLSCVIGSSVGANLMPKILHDLRHGPNARGMLRYPYEAEFYGLRLASLLLPSHVHRVGVLRELRSAYIQAFAPVTTGETEFATLGILGSVGFLLLIGRFLTVRRDTAPGVPDALAVLNLFAVLLAVTGGFGPLVNFLGSPMIRGYNRISIFIAFFAFCTLAVVADRIRSRLVAKRSILAYHVALGGALILGLLDQVGPAFVPPYDQLKQAFRNDAGFVHQVESALPRRAMVFQLPSVPFPEVPPVGTMGCYDHFRAYLHSRHLRWSHGTIPGREADGWRTRIAEMPPEEQAPTLVYSGFRGIWIDRSAYPDQGADLEARLTRVMGCGPMISGDGRYSLFPLTDYAKTLRSRCTEAEWLARRDEARRPVMVCWGSGFFPEERSPQGTFHWARDRSEMKLVNDGICPREVTLRMRCSSAMPGPCKLRIRGLGWDTTLDIDSRGQSVERKLILPPGTHRVLFACKGRPAPVDFRTLIFRVDDLCLERVDAAEPASIAVTRQPTAAERR